MASTSLMNLLTNRKIASLRYNVSMADINLTPSDGMVAAAKRALKWHEDGKFYPARVIGLGFKNCECVVKFLGWDGPTMSIIRTSKNIRSASPS